MEIVQKGVAGTLESSDLMVMVEKNEKKEIQIQLKSSVEQQFGDEIKKVVLMVLEEFGITRCKLSIADKGALDCTIIARLRTALSRACDMKEFNWREQK
ncbi:citrate lyase acyl carrier protein [Cellulosilyticum sp. I15G10I2]|uniref:citrate lyase acyl carrier protein n=1 Tax=Cellulosilyticum sp. I15G10I2 TaxID=1892843 RepID=UPI00085C4996|nr:citrate lyase acyl carrier protein [Cellulosilyticum sp. I15G10I2]